MDGIRAERHWSHVSGQELARADNGDEHLGREQIYTPTGHRIFYNDVAAYETCTIVEGSIAASREKVQVRARCNWLAIAYEWGGRQRLIVKCHMPTSWRPVAEYEDAIEQLRQDIIDLGGAQNGTITAVMGDMSIPWPTAECVPPQ